MQAWEKPRDETCPPSLCFLLSLVAIQTLLSQKCLQIMAVLFWKADTTTMGSPNDKSTSFVQFTVLIGMIISLAEQDWSGALKAVAIELWSYIYFPLHKLQMQPFGIAL